MTHRPLLKKQIEYAQTQTKSHWAAARFMNVSYKKYKRFAVAYGLFFNDHLNPAGKGIRKMKMTSTTTSRSLRDILDGKFPNYNRKKLLRRLISAGWLQQKCKYCGVNHTRVNGRGPYALDYVDGNADNLVLENLQIICFNCRYLTRGTMMLPEDMIPQSYDTTDIVDGEMNEEDILKLRDELQSDQFHDDEDDNKTI